MSQQTRFTAPVRPGDTITARAVVTAWDAEKGRVTLSTTVTNQDGTTVIDGEARMVMQAYLQKRAKGE